MISPAERERLRGLILQPGDLTPTGTTREGRPEFRLNRPVTFEDVTVPAGYVTDKHSLPGIIKAWQPKGEYWAGPPIIHDWLFETQIKPFEESNLIYHRAMKAIGVKRRHRLLAYLAVQWKGRRGYGKVDADNWDMVVEHSKAAMLSRRDERATTRMAFKAIREAAMRAAAGEPS